MASGTTLHTLRLIAGVLPALLVVVFAGLIALVALVMNDKRREYALEFAQKSVDLATVLVGVSSDRERGSLTRIAHADRHELPNCVAQTTTWPVPLTEGSSLTRSEPELPGPAAVIDPRTQR